jgi:hypothetical protein
MAHRQERRIVFRAMQDYLMTPFGKARPSIRKPPNVIRLWSFEAARAKGTTAIREIGPELSPWGDKYVSTRQRINTEVRFTHE